MGMSCTSPLTKYVLQRMDAQLRICIQYPRFGESVVRSFGPSIHAITIVALKFIQFETGDHRQQQQQPVTEGELADRPAGRPSL